MSKQRNLEIGRKMMDAVNNKDLDTLDELVAPDYENHQLQVKNREELKQVLSRQYKGFPDVHRELEDIIADESKVWIRVKITGTHTGEYRGIPPSGKKIIMMAVPVYRISGGKIVEGWSVWSSLDLFKQLGVVDYKGFPDELQQPL
ncbi:MAG: ester cyclase [Candidatus Thorarchaeota archaeon]